MVDSHSLEKRSLMLSNKFKNLEWLVNVDKNIQRMNYSVEAVEVKINSNICV